MPVLTWELLGAAVGAGLASGREIASFFGRYGRWGYAGIALAVGAMALLAGARMPPCWQGRWPARTMQGLWTAMLLVTGGAMLAGAGEVAAMLHPGRGARWTVMAATMLLAWLLAKRTRRGLSRVGAVMMAGMAALVALMLMRPPVQAAWAAERFVPGGMLRAAAYGGFNAALLHPLMAGRTGTRRPLMVACALLMALLSAGLAALLRHPGAMDAAMPFAAMAGMWGRGALMLAAACLFLAVLSTLTACLRGLGGPWGAAGVAALAVMGFTGVVEAAYPVLGAACAAMLAAMRASNFVNSCRKPFHSRPGVL